MKIIFSKKELSDFADREQLLISAAHLGDTVSLFRFWTAKRIQFRARALVVEA